MPEMPNPALKSSPFKKMKKFYLKQKTGQDLAFLASEKIIL